MKCKWCSIIKGEMAVGKRVGTGYVPVEELGNKRMSKDSTRRRNSVCFWLIGFELYYLTEGGMF